MNASIAKKQGKEKKGKPTELMSNIKSYKVCKAARLISGIPSRITEKWGQDKRGSRFNRSPFISSFQGFALCCVIAGIYNIISINDIPLVIQGHVDRGGEVECGKTRRKYSIEHGPTSLDIARWA